MSTKNILNQVLEQVTENKRSCKNHKLTRTANPKQEYIIREPLELIQIWDCRYGDQNDVIDSNDVRATRSMIDEYAKDFFKSRYWDQLDDLSDGESIVYSIYENEDQCYTIDCQPIGNSFNSWHTFIDLIHPNPFSRDQPKYIINNKED